MWRLNLAVMLNKIGRKADAQKVLRDAMEAIPTSWSAALTLGGYMEAEGNLDEASKLYRRALDLNPSWPRPPRSSAGSY